MVVDVDVVSGPLSLWNMNTGFTRGAGCGTNMKAEAMALWGLLWFTSFLSIPTIHIYMGTHTPSLIMFGVTCISSNHIYKASSKNHDPLGVLQERLYTTYRKRVQPRCRQDVQNGLTGSTGWYAYRDSDWRFHTRCWCFSFPRITISWKMLYCFLSCFMLDIPGPSVDWYVIICESKCF